MIPHSKPFISDSDIESVARQMRSNMLASGVASRDFEAAILRWTGGASAIATKSGSAAQKLCLKSLGIGFGDEVIVPTYVCESVMRVVQSLGAEAIPCDSGKTWNASRESIFSKITSRTKAVILVNIFGIENDASDLGIPVIEDHCQSFGLSKLKSHAGFYSFHATKCLTTGEGGAAVFSSSVSTDSLRLYADQLPDMQAALGLSQLKKYDSMLDRRKSIAKRYFNELSQPLTEDLQLLSSMYFRFPIMMEGAFAEIQRRFAENGVAVRRPVEELRHRAIGVSDRKYPNASRIYDKTVSIPIYPAMTDEEVDKVISVTKMITSQFASARK